MKRKKVGQVAFEEMLKAPESQDPIEIEREMQKEYIDELVKCVESSKKFFDKDFYVVVITKNEKLLPNVFRNYFLARQSCPSPDYDQSVYKYNHQLEQIEYIWTVPSQEASHHLKNNAHQVHPSERQLLDFVLQFSDGSLFLKATQLNNELLH